MRRRLGSTAVVGLGLVAVVLVPDPAELEALVVETGWSLQVQADCRPRPNSFARVTLCSASGEVDDHAVTVSLLGESRTETTPAADHPEVSSAAGLVGGASYPRVARISLKVFDGRMTAVAFSGSGR